MGYKLLYLIWGLLPLSLFLLALWARVKRIAKVHGREPAGEYFVQGLFCLAVLLVTIWIDSNFFDAIMEAALGGLVDPSIPRFLLYPVVLLVAAQLSGLVKKSPPPKKPRA